MEASTVLIPSELEFVVGPISFSGPYCKPNILFQVNLLQNPNVCPKITRYKAWVFSPAITPSVPETRFFFLNYMSVSTCFCCFIRHLKPTLGGCIFVCQKNVRSIEELYTVFFDHVTISGQIMQQKYNPNEHKEKCWY